MGNDRLRPSIFDRLEPGQQANIPLLLDAIYGEIMHKVSILETQLKGQLSKQGTDLNRADERLKKIEACPCAVHRDPGHSCVILDVRDELAGIRADSAAAIGKIQTDSAEKLSAINNRLARWGGGLAVILILIEVLTRLLPLVWR